MTDNLKKRGKPDRDRINLHEDWEVRDWCEHYKCVPAELHKAVETVGQMVVDVDVYFIMNPAKPQPQGIINRAMHGL